jgi:thiol:disulfide interchange protein DsbC
MRKFIFILFIASILITLLVAGNSYSTDTCDHTCSKCHQLTKEEALNLLKESIQDVKILEIRPSPVMNLWEIAVETKDQKGIVYVDYSRKHVISGSILNLKTKSNLTQERFTELNKIDISQVPLGDALVMGDKDAKYRVIVFDDPD